MNQVDYDPSPMSEIECAAMSPGDEVFFIDPRPESSKGLSGSLLDEELLRRLDYTVVHVERVIKDGFFYGFQIVEYPNSGLAGKCFHMITGLSPIQEEDFDAVFV